MFHREPKKSKSRSVKSLKDLMAIDAPEQLLADNKRQALILKISEASGLDPALFRKIGITLIQNLTKYCQNLPETDHYYALAGGLVDRALNRTEAALHIFRQRLVQGHNEPVSEEQKIWLYALFSAAILQGIGKLYTDYRVDLFDSNGHYVKQWQPLLEDFISVGKYYHYEFLRGDNHEFRCNVTMLLARQLMPQAGFSWISSNPEIFSVWLSLLHEDMASADALGAILDRANAISIQRYVTDFLVKHTLESGGRGNRINTFVDTPTGTVIDKERALGAEFITWLTKALSSGRVVINKFPLMMVVQGGMLMSPELFKMFVDQHPRIKNAEMVARAFLAWGLHHVGADGSMISRVEHTDKQQMLEGIKIDTAILPEEVKLYHSTTNKETTLSSMDLVAMTQSSNYFYPSATKDGSSDQRLSMSGKWGMEDKGNLLKPGSVQRV